MMNELISGAHTGNDDYYKLTCISPSLQVLEVNASALFEHHISSNTLLNT
jgi:hypothetical protein